MPWPLALGLLLAPAAHAAWMPPLPQHAAYGEAASQLADGQLGPAEAGFRAVLAADPDCGMARHSLGVTLLRKGQLAQAQEELAAVVAGWPDRPEGHTALSVVHFARQDFGAARAAAQAAVAAAPASVDANAALLEVQLRQGDLDGARGLVGAARGAGVSAAVLACFDVQIGAEAGDTALVQAALPQCLRGGTPELVVAARARAGTGGTVQAASAAGARDLVAVAQAVDLMRDGELGAARALLDGVLARSPDRTDARLLRARCLAALGERAAARADLEQAFTGSTWVDVHASGAMSGILRKSDEAALEREVARGAGLLVELLAQDGELPAARAALERFAARWPQAPPLVVARARLREAEGDPAGAWAVLDSALASGAADPVLVEAAAQLALRAPDTMPPRLRARVAAGGAWTDRYNLAIAERKAGRTAACRDIAAEALSGPGQPTAPDHRQRLAALVHRCGVEAGDLATADRSLAPAGGPATLGPVLAYNHALLRQQAGDAAGAWSLIAPHAAAPPDDPATAAAITTLGLRLSVDQGELGAGLAIARLAPTPAGEKVRVVQPLIEAGRLTEATEVLTAACPALSGDQGVRCTTLLDQLQGG